MVARYLVGPVANNIANWSATSGGAGGASVPTTSDDAIVDANSPSFSIGTARTFGSLNFTGFTGTVTMDANITVTGTGGGTTLSPTMTIVDSGGVLAVQNNQTLTANGKVWNAGFQFNSSATFTLADQWDVASLISPNSNVVVNGTKLRVGGGWTITGTTTTVMSGTCEVELYGSGTVASSLTSGSVRSSVTFAAGSNYTITGTFGYGTGLLKLVSGATLNVSAATLDIRAACSIDMNGFTWPNFTWNASTATVTLVNPLTLGVTNFSTSNVTFAGAKLTVTGNTTCNQGSGVITVADLDFVGPLTITNTAFTTGRFAGNVTFVSGTITLAGTFSHGGGNLTKAAGCTLVTTGSTLILQGAASTVDLSPAVMNNVTILGAFTHTLNSILYVSGALVAGSTAVTTIINGSEIIYTGSSITSTLTTGSVTGTSPLRIKETCSLNASVLTTGCITVPHIIDAPGKTITLTKWTTNFSTWQVLSGSVVNAAGQMWVNTQTVIQRSGRVVDPFIKPNSNPRLYFRAWTTDNTVATPLTTLTASSISTAQYRRKVNNIYGSAVNVGAITDAAEFSSYAVGNLIKHSCALGNLYSIDAPLVASSDGAEAVRLELSLVSGTVDVFDHILKIGYSKLEDSTINNIAVELSPIIITEITPALAAELSPVLTAEMSPALAEELWQTNYGELSSVPSALSTMRDKISWLFMWTRNKATQTKTERKLYADDGSTVISIDSISDDGTTFVKDKAHAP